MSTLHTEDAVAVRERPLVRRRAHAAPPLGILMFETPIPSGMGDVSSPDTFPFPVRYRTVPRNAVARIADAQDDALLALFVHAAAELIDEGCIGIASTCSFLARWQRELTESLSVPVLSSSLLQVPLIQRLLPHRQRVGIVINSPVEVDAATLQAAGADAFVSIECVDPEGHFATAVRHGSALPSRAQMAADVVSAARRLVATHPRTGAIVLEYANMSPYRDAVEAAVGIPVFSAADLIRWFHAGLRGTHAPYAANPF